MRSSVTVVAPLVVALLLGDLVWYVAGLADPVLPLEVAVAGLLLGLGLWVLARGTPTPWWALVLATVPAHLVGVVIRATEPIPPELADRRGLDLLLTVASYAVAIAAGAVGAHRGARRRADRTRVLVPA